MSESGWNPSPPRYDLPADEVHVWRAGLAQPAEAIEHLRQVLSSEERIRAERYRLAADRHRAVIGRGLVRRLLGLCLDLPPEGLAFETGPYGKPALAPGRARDGGAALHFNVSHAGAWILVALARGRPVGVDVEEMRPGLASEPIARRFFSPRERQALLDVPQEGRVEAFFACWTRKEAYIKARGDGLTLALDSFDVSLAPGEEPRLLATRHDPTDAARWRLAALRPGAGHAGAVMAEGQGWRLRCWNCQHGAD